MYTDPASATATPPLAGLRILDLSRVLAGPWATQLLADFGAEVIKIERPGTGDDTRAWGPPWLQDDQGHATAESAYFLAANRGKQSVVVDLAHPAGQALVAELTGHCDVLVENFKLGALARMGLDYATLSARHPRLIYCSITGFGQTGPRANQPGYDAMIQAMGGLMSITGQPDDEGGQPVKVGVAVADLMCGMYAVAAILAAVIERQRSGVGQHLDLALFDTQLAWLANQGMNWLVGGVLPQRQGSAHPNIVPYQAFATADGHLMLAVGNDAQFARCCVVLGCAELALDPRYRSNADRVAHRAALLAELQPRLAAHPLDHWLHALTAADVPCGPINTLDHAYADPQVHARELLRTLTHPQCADLPSIAQPARFSRSPVQSALAPPLLGADTYRVLSRLGLAPSRIQTLLAQQVIDGPAPGMDCTRKRLR